MKKMILSLVVLSAFAGTAQATQATCEQDMETLSNCKPKTNNLVGTIAICKQGSKYFLGVESNGSNPEVFETKPDARTGATTFPLAEGNTHIGDLVVTATFTGNGTRAAKFYVDMGANEKPMEIAYTCSIKK